MSGVIGSLGFPSLSSLIPAIGVPKLSSRELVGCNVKVEENNGSSETLIAS